MMTWLSVAKIVNVQDKFEVAVARKLDEIKHDYAMACSGSADCVVGNKTYKMNAGEEHANRMFSGYTLAKSLFDSGQGPESMMITDFDDVDHPDVSLADAHSVAIQQGAHFAAQRQRKNDLRRQIGVVEIGTGTLEEALAKLAGVVWIG